MDTPNTTPSEQTNPTSPKTELPFSVTSTDTTTYTSEPSEGRWLYPLLVAALILLVAGGFFAWKSLNHASDNGLPEDIASTSTASNGSNANLAIVPPASNATGTGTAANTTWNLYSFTLGGHAISFQIPSGHHAYLDGNQVVVVPDLTEENDSPLPDMTIRLFPNMTLENLKKIDQPKAPEGIQVWQDFSVYGLTGQALNITGKGYPGVNLFYLLPVQKDVFEFRLWEDLEWKPFDEVVKTFRVSQ